MKTQVAIIGHGFVGKATERLLKTSKHVGRIHIQDIKYKKRISPDEWDFIRYAFICVPTPLEHDVKVSSWEYEKNRFDMSHIEKATKDIPKKVQIVIRSTVGPENLQPEWIHMPEFLREKHWEKDIDDKSIPIMIGCPYDEELLDWFPDRTTLCLEPKEAAMYKLSRNAMLAAKVTLVNYLYKVCNAHNVDYENVKDMLKQYADLGDSHWDVPGPDGKFGFGGTCFPKDTTHFASLTRGKNIFESILKINERTR